MTSPELESRIATVAFWVVIATLIYTVVGRFIYYDKHQGITVLNTALTILFNLLFVWIAVSCRKGTRWLNIVMCVLSVLYLAGIANYLVAASMFDEGFLSPLDLINGVVSSIAWITLCVLSLRKGKLTHISSGL